MQFKTIISVKNILEPSHVKLGRRVITCIIPAFFCKSLFLKLKLNLANLFFIIILYIIRPVPHGHVL